jgi:ABC-type sugar transport system ATPase subunit
MNIFEVKYDNGTLSIGESYSIELKEEYAKKHDAYYEAEVDRLNKEISRLEEEINGCEEFLEKKANKEKVDKNSKYADNNYMNYVKMELEKIKPLLEKYQEIVKTKSHMVRMGIRPEDVIRPEDATKKVRLSNKFKTKVELSELLGREYYVHFVLDKFRLISKISDNDLISVGDEIELGFNLNNLHIFDIDTTNLIF